MTPLDVLDPRTLAASAALAGLVFSAVLFGALRDGDAIKGAREWFFAAVLISVALATNAMQDLIPEVLSRVIANVALIAGCFMLWQGARRFNDRSSVLPWLYIASAIALAGNFVFTLVWPSIPLRIAITAFGLLVGTSLAAVELRRAKAAHLRYGVAIAAWPMFVFAFFMGVRVYMGLFGSAVPASLAQTPINVLTHLIGSFVLLTTLAGLTIIVNATRAAHVKSLAYSDQLTGVLSRRGFYSAISSKRDRPISLGEVFVFDIDQFKSANDSKGHETGDKLLKLLASTIRDYAPHEALIARFGGDEFVVLTETNVDAKEFCEKVCKSFRDRSGAVLNESTLFGRHESELVAAEVSVGHARCDKLGEPALSHALREADRAMYDAKIRKRQLRQG